MASIELPHNAAAKHQYMQQSDTYTIPKSKHQGSDAEIDNLQVKTVEQYPTHPLYLRQQSLLVYDKKILRATLHKPKPLWQRLDIVPWLLLYLLVAQYAVPAIIYESYRPPDPDLNPMVTSTPSTNSTSPIDALLGATPLKSLADDEDDDDVYSVSESLQDAPVKLDLNVHASTDSEATRESEEYKRMQAEFDALPVPSRTQFVAMFSIPFCIAAHLACLLSCFWNVKTRALCRYLKVAITDMQSATHICVEPATHNGTATIEPLQRNSGRDGAGYWFDFQATKYFFNYNNDSQSFIADHLHAGNSGHFKAAQLPVSNPLHTYINTKGIETLETQMQHQREYGDNYFDIPLPAFMDLFYEHAMAPFFVFQVFCVMLWCLDEYWYYSMLTLCMLIMFEATLVKRRQKSLEDLRAMRQKVFLVYAYRSGKWQHASTQYIYPHDIISLVRSKADEVCPADVLLLNGSAVVNEALLTGESVPQIKERVEAVVDENEELSVSKDHKRSIIFGGTKLMLTHSTVASSTPDRDSADSDAIVKPSRASSIPPPPDNGCVAYVLRTGFHTSQGDLVRTILFSADRVSINNREAIAFIGFLLVFAIAAAGYVLQHGLADPERSRYKLLLNCIMIITSVVPPELPMELSLAVNTSLLMLSRCAIFCTEPFRIPVAGAIDVCAFDKTGTLTSDNFVVKGIAGLQVADASTTNGHATPAANAQPQQPNKQVAIITEVDRQHGLTAAEDVQPEVKYALGGCHSLVTVDGKLVGDPLEAAAFNAIKFQLDGDVSSGLLTATDAKPTKIRIIHRYPFNSTLKRMSCIISVETSVQRQPQIYIVAKGAAEIMQKQMTETAETYDATHAHYSRQGCRVLALGYRHLAEYKDSFADRSKLIALARDEVERDLKFAGFLVLEVPMKPDSAAAVQHLIESNHHVIMITGDNTLTACSVASQLKIADRPLLILSHAPPAIPSSHGDAANGVNGTEPPTTTNGASTNGHTKATVTNGTDPFLRWSSVDDTNHYPFDATLTNKSLAPLVEKYDLCISGDAMDYLTQTLRITNQQLSTLIRHSVVYARSTPDQKELIVRSLKEAGSFVLMCGDGSNDVGALKQAHVGVALIQAPEQPANPTLTDGAAINGVGAPAVPPPAAVGTTAALSAPSALQQNTIRQQQQATPAKPASNNPFAMPTLKPPPKPLNQMTKEEVSAYQKQQISELLSQMDDRSAPMIRLGDASIASPFTSKRPFISSCLDIIRQGRCTLVTTLQMYHILGINCLMSAYSMSVLYLDGVKYGDYQLTISGMSVAMFFMFLSNSKPMERLSPERPPTKLFTPYMLISVAGQWVIHMLFLLYVISCASIYIPASHEHRQLKKEFQPNILNTVVFLLSNTTTVTTFFCNYRGQPFMQSLNANSSLKKALYMTFGLMMLLVTDWMPELNYWLELVPMPSEIFRTQIIWAMLGDLAVTYLFVRFVNRISARPPPPLPIEHQFRSAEHQQKVVEENARLEREIALKQKAEAQKRWDEAKARVQKQMADRQQAAIQAQSRKAR